jgi:acyl-coenzyme A thioesterase PaaI-like protein
MTAGGPWRTLQPRESLRIWLYRLGFNFFPAFRGTGARVIYLSEDRRKVRIKLPLNFRTRNIHGTLFGGAMYAATDPLYAVLLKVALGPGYVVWDKAGAIRHKKPGRSALYAECSLSDAQVASMRKRLDSEPSVDLHYEIELVNERGEVHAVVQKTIYAARKEVYKARNEALHAGADPADGYHNYKG